MQQATLKIVLSLVGAGVAGFAFLFCWRPYSRARMPPASGAVLFRFQLSSMIAMAVFAGLAIVIYVRLSRIRK